MYPIKNTTTSAYINNLKKIIIVTKDTSDKIKGGQFQGITNQFIDTSDSAFIPQNKMIDMSGVTPTVATFMSSTSGVVLFNSVSGATLYTVTPSGGNAQTDLSYSAGGVTVTGLSPNTSYTFTVQAQNAFGTGTASNATSSITTPPTMSGVTPTVATFTSSTSGVVLFSSVSGATLYTVTPSGSSAQTGLSYSAGGVTVTGLSPNTAYTFTVQAQNAFGTGTSSSASSSITTPPTMSGVTPTATALTATTVSLAFSSITGATSYTTTPSGGSPQTGLSYSSGIITATGLTGSTSYTFTVQAQNAFGTGTASNSSNIITTPSALNITVSNTTTGQTGKPVSFTVTASSSITGTVTLTALVSGSACGEWVSAGNTISQTQVILNFSAATSASATFTPLIVGTIVITGTTSISGAMVTVTNPNITATAYTPDISGTALTFWLDADNLTPISNGAELTTWVDRKSSITGTGFGTTKATYITNGYNARPCVRFVKSSLQYYSFGTTATLQGGSNMSWFAVYLANPGDNKSTVFGRTLYAGVADRYSFSPRYGGNESNSITTGNAAGQYSISPTATSSFCLASFTYNLGGTFVQYRNGGGTAIASISIPDTTPLTGTSALLLGAYGNSVDGTTPVATATDNLYLNGDICEILLYKTTLSTPDRQAVEAYLMEKWGLNIPTNVAGTSVASPVVTWIAPVGLTGITDYLVRYKLTTNVAYTSFGLVGGTGTTKTVTGLPSGSYNFVVCAVVSGVTQSPSRPSATVVVP